MTESGERAEINNLISKCLLGHATVRETVQAAFEAGRGGQSEAQKFLIKAVTRYANGYMQDEAHEREVCISDDQHEAAKDVFEALKMPAPPDSGDKKEAERG